MQVTCSICDAKEEINDRSPIAKQLRNRPIHTYLCDKCNDRIKIRTIERWETGKFRLYKKKPTKNDW
ncbi:YlaI family protein [Pullulanibacillus camelliae]|nr:YlaI family protein [Pullulanibacillus camelliae]